MSIYTNINITDVADAAVVTHSGPFHADDVMAVAIAKLAWVGDWEGCEMPVARTRDLEGAAAATILDVGGVFNPSGGQFDHHQRGFTTTRKGGVKYSSCGLLWDFRPEWAVLAIQAATRGRALSPEQVTDVCGRVSSTLIASIDAVDNGQRAKLAEAAEGEVVPPTYSFSSLIGSMNPTGTDEDFDTAFEAAVDVAATALVACIKQAAADVLSEERVKATVVAGDELVVFDQFEAAALAVVPMYSKPLYMVFPSNGSWMVQQVPKSPGSFEGRKPLPEAWAGLRAENGDSIEGIESFVFVHNGRFIGGCGTKDDAIRMARMAIEA